MKYALMHSKRNMSVAGFKGIFAASILLGVAACSSGPNGLGSQLADSSLSNSLTIAPDPYASTALNSNDWQSAESILASKLENDPLKMINLAYVYRMTGRQDDAVSLYQQVLNMASNPYASRVDNAPLRVKTIARLGLEEIQN